MKNAVEAIRLFRLLNRDQRNTFVACFLGWALDAFDFFLLTFVIVPMAHDFGTSVADLSYAITITLAMRPVGAFIFGLLGDRFGRRIPLMIDIIFYSLMEVLTAFFNYSPGCYIASLNHKKRRSCAKVTAALPGDRRPSPRRRLYNFASSLAPDLLASSMSSNGR